MNHSPSVQARLVLFLVISSLVAFGIPLVRAEEDSVVPTPPHLVSVITVTQVRGEVMLTGSDFTPGGRVYVVLYGAWGRQLLENRWITASETVYGPNDSQDPASGYVQGGTISEHFGPETTIYGPNGSQDSASGYVRRDDQSVGSLCGVATLLAQAYDLQKKAWSNLLEVDAGCQNARPGW